MLSAEVAEHIGVPVRFLEQLHLSLNQAEALSEEPLHSYCPSLKLSSERWTKGWEFRESRYKKEGSGPIPKSGSLEECPSFSCCQKGCK